MSEKKKYRVSLSQSYIQDFTVSFEVESNLELKELKNSISDLTIDWSIARLSEEELLSSGEIEGYVKESYSTWDGDLDPSDEVSVSVKETND
jgi:hypothetical protein